MRRFLRSAATAVLFLLVLPLRSAGEKPDVPPRELADRIIEAAMLYIGSPYQYHAVGPNAFDCSGFTSFIFKQYGIGLPHASAEQAKTGRELDGLPSHLQKGDLVFFSGRRKSSTVGHVGIFIEATDGGKSFRFIHAARGGVMVSELKEDYYASRYLGASRVLGDFKDEEPPVPDERLDTLKAQEGKVVAEAVRDTLHLHPSDSRIVLFSNGTWAEIAGDGSVRVPDRSAKIILDGDGRWHELGAATEQRSTAQPRGTQAAEAETGSATYQTVVKGDTLGKIAARYHTSVAALCRLNNIQPSTILHIGRRLKVR